MKFKGEIALASTKGNRVVLHLAELYVGDQPAVRAVDLTKEFMTDRDGTIKKYNLRGFEGIIVEGVVLQIDADRLGLKLAGHKE
jgi:hypothetical protein